MQESGEDMSYFRTVRQSLRFPFPFKVNVYSYFSSAAEDMRTSSDFLSALAPGEINVSPMPVTLQKQYSSKDKIQIGLFFFILFQDGVC